MGAHPLPLMRAGRLAGIVALAVLALVGCGKKGPPIAPELRVPQPATLLKAYIDDGAIVVSWTNPRSRADLSSLRDLTTVTLYRREDVDGGPLKPALLRSGRVVGYAEIATVHLATPAPAVVEGDTVRWIDRRGLTIGHRYVYVVTASDSTGRTSAPSERLAVPFLAPPEPPRNVKVTPGDGRATIAWDPPTAFADGTPVAGPLLYFVLRGTGSDGALAPITPSGVSGTSYQDSGLENDTEYRYAVRAVRADPRVAAAGVPSTMVAATPADTTPPSAPRDLVAVPSPGAMRLAWTASPEADVALYAVYRATGTGAFTRIGTTLAGTTLFVDQDVRPGTRYRYAVTALDRARHANESARSNEVAVVAR